MQEIFYDGKIITNNEQKDVAEAMIINDGSVFFVGEKEEVMNLKTDDTKIHNLKKHLVYPSLCDVQANMFHKIDENLKNAKTFRSWQNSDDIDENYENFAHFDDYKEEYLKLEKQYIKAGITTVFDLNIDKKSFAFWKKMAEEKLLALDVVGYVDIINAKQVMDDNCVTYRKYKNHFRLGGYNIKIDGKIQTLLAWLNKPYSGTKSHYGMGEFYGEHLYYILKMALEEKKQVLFEVNGDKALGEVLTVLSEIEEKEKISEFYRPIFYGASVLNKTLIKKIKHFDGTIIFEEFNKQETKQIKKFLGFVRAKLYHNYKLLINNNIRFLVVNRCFDLQNFSSVLDLWFKNKKIVSRFKNKEIFKQKMTEFILNGLYQNPAYICFDQETKASLETQKKANFIVISDDIFNCKTDVEKKIKSVYIDGEKKY